MAKKNENKQAALNTFFEPPIAPPVASNQEDAFDDVSPQVTFAYRSPRGAMFYVTAVKGFKAGGFNPVALPGSEAYGVETSWNYEGGVKTTLVQDRVTLNGDVFFTQWDDMQVNVPNPFVPGQFYISNVGSARSSGIEFDVTARPMASLDLFAGLGVTSAEFSSGTVANGIAVDGNDLPYTPDYTATLEVTGNLTGDDAISLTWTATIAATDPNWTCDQYRPCISTIEQRMAMASP